jgi:predicted ArsR family transcriptional regulator
MGTIGSVNDITIALDRDIFLRTLIREVAGVLEEVIGVEEASGYISLVGQNIGDWMNALYKKELGVSALTQSQVADVLVDLKKRIQGNFSVVSQTNDRIVLENTACPFAEKVLDRPSLCMMTSNVFGVIAAENLGYAKVALEKTIAKNDERCRVVVYLKPSAESEAAEGREYFGTR